VFEEALQHVEDTLKGDPTISQFTVMRNTAEDYDAKMRNALREDGICIVVAALAGNLAGEQEQVARIRHEIVVAVAENPATNQSGETLLSLVERVIEVVHQSKVPSEKGIRNTITVDQPAYETGDIDEGPMTYFVNFRYKTITG
jgi:hypothetical protein